MKRKKINILSLFAGMGTLELALKNQGFVIGKSYASEIKPAALKLMAHHFPDTIQLGDIRNWREWDINWADIDFVGSGSPCQDLSIAGKRAGLKGERSSLFFVFVDILNHIRKLNPDVLFLQENVASAPKQDIIIMSRKLGIYPQMVDSLLWLPQSRKRFYWSNIKYSYKGLFKEKTTDFPIPKKRKNIFAKDIIVSGRVNKKHFPTLTERYIKANNYKNNEKLTKRLLTKSMPYVIQINESKESNGKQPFNQNRIYDINGILPALCTRNYGKIQENETIRILNKVELCRLQGFPDDYCDMVSYNQAGSLLGDAWSLPVIEFFVSFIDKSKFETISNEYSTAHF